MTFSTHEERTLTELDHLRLSKLIDKAGAATLLDCLDAAELVPSRDVPSDVVTMNSQVLLVDPDDGTRQTLTLCYPADAAPTAGHVSVLSPVGASLLGLRVGATARWRAPDGRRHRAMLQALLHQPEASGDFRS